MILSSQDFRNSYEEFYMNIRNYLWPYDALKALAEVENDIFTAFIDFDLLQRDVDKLYSFIKDTMKEDKRLEKSFNEIYDLIQDSHEDDTKIYSFLRQVAEVNPTNDKQIRTIPEEEEQI